MLILINVKSVLYGAQHILSQAKLFQKEISKSGHRFETTAEVIRAIL